jgi:threonine/homoserine/homoserine lactone efflux protein
MPEAHLFGLFFTAAVLLAITPGPGIFYVLTRSLKGGRQEGILSTCGTSLGGLAHVLAAALGLSALLATSSMAFTLVKFGGAAYIIYLGILALRQDEDALALATTAGPAPNAFRQGVITEVLNPKTALFFLVFIPQFINPNANPVLQFIVLGSISIALNTTVDIGVALLAGPLGQWLQTHPRFRRQQRLFTGWGLIGLGAYVALADSKE